MTLAFYLKSAQSQKNQIYIKDDEQIIADFISQCSNSSCSNSSLQEFLHSNRETATFLANICCYSPHLKRVMLANQQFLLDILLLEPEEFLRREIDKIRQFRATSEDNLRSYLRQRKVTIFLALALAEISECLENSKICYYISLFAENCLEITLQYLFSRNLQNQSKPFKSSDISKSGFIVLSMGKLGGYELNYSSDIDLILFLDQQKFQQNISENIASHGFFITLSQQLLAIFEDNSVDGYVFRVDLRLRPDANSTQIVISTDAGLFYYESRGENWERSAYIKARPIAADISAGEKFLSELYPFIWRKNIDYSALDDIHALKIQIIKHKRKIESESLNHLAGENIKLCRGGIRDIEFFTQAQQLLLGAYIETLHKRQTCESLDNLCKAGLISRKCSKQMQSAYWFLRKLEHRLQMVNDLQTHNLPGNDADMLCIAHFCGFANSSVFLSFVKLTLNNVQKNYDELFAKISTDCPDNRQANELFFGTVDIEHNISVYLKQTGFVRIAEGSKIIFSWLSGRYNATRSQRSRLMLRSVLKHVIDAFVETSQPDEALIAFDKFLLSLPAGLQLFALMKGNPNIIRLLCSSIAIAPALSWHLSRFSDSIDRLIYAPDVPVCRTAAHYHNQVAIFFKSAKKNILSFEDALDALRQFTNQEKFHIAVDFLSKKHDGITTGRHFAFLAEALCTKTLDICRKHFAAKHGEFENQQIALVLQGGVGRSMLHFTSDLDIVMIYEVPLSKGEVPLSKGGHEAQFEGMSNGKKPLPVMTYFTRLCQLFIAGISAQSAKGVIYDVDMRLRPSGNAGPVTASFESFSYYHQNESWDWEKISLFRTKIIGDHKLKLKLQNIIKNVLNKNNQQTVKLRNNLINMRRTIAENFPGEGINDVKYENGGLIDLDFSLAFLQLKNVSKYPEILEAKTDKTIQILAKNAIISQKKQTQLINAFEKLINLQQILKLTNNSIETNIAQKIFCEIIEVDNFQQAKEKIAEAKNLIHNFYQKNLGEEYKP